MKLNLRRRPESPAPSPAPSPEPPSSVPVPVPEPTPAPTGPPEVWSRAEIAGVLPRALRDGGSAFRLPIGLTSSDGSAITGAGGHLFLIGASNGLLGQYDRDAHHATVLGDRWATVVRERQRRADELGVRFLQVFIPEKLSVLAELSGGLVSGPTPAYRQIIDNLADEPCLVDALPLLRGIDAPYRTLDTHLTATGARTIFAEVGRRSGLVDPDLVQAVRCDQESWVQGDLVARFGLPFLDRIDLPDVDRLPEAGTGVETVIDEPAPDGKHIGSVFSWRNPAGTGRALVFGNSFFGSGKAPGDLSWWAKHLFAEVTFLWETDVDWERVAAEAPDVVIGQTIERYVGRVPQA